MRHSNFSTTTFFVKELLEIIEIKFCGMERVGDTRTFECESNNNNPVSQKLYHNKVSVVKVFLSY